MNQFMKGKIELKNNQLGKFLPRNASQISMEFNSGRLHFHIENGLND